MAATGSTPQPYADALLEELDGIESAYVEVLEASAVVNIDPGPGFFGFPPWGWQPSDGDLEARRMALLAQVRDLRPRFELLFPHPTPEVSQRHSDTFELLENWLVRPGGDYSVPGSVDSAVTRLRSTLHGLRDARRLLPDDEIRVRVVVDTNALIDCPDLKVYAGQLGRRYRVHLLPVVLGEYG